MRTDQFDKGDWKQIDQALKPHLKSTLNLPDRACTDYMYGNSKDGLFGVLPAAEDSDIAKIDTPFKLLMSIDPNVKTHARDDLKLVFKTTLLTLLLPISLIFFPGLGTVTPIIVSLPFGLVPVRPLTNWGSPGSLPMPVKFQLNLTRSPSPTTGMCLSRCATISGWVGANLWAVNPIRVKPSPAFLFRKLLPISIGKVIT